MTLEPDPQEKWCYGHYSIIATRVKKKSINQSIGIVRTFAHNQSINKTDVQGTYGGCTGNVRLDIARIPCGYHGSPASGHYLFDDQQKSQNPTSQLPGSVVNHLALPRAHRCALEAGGVTDICEPTCDDAAVVSLIHCAGLMIPYDVW